MKKFFRNKIMLRESALRSMVRILLESRAIDDEAARLAGKDERRREGWEAAARAFDGIGAGKQMLGWMANLRNVKPAEPLEPFVAQLLDWARGKDEGVLSREEADLSRLTPEALRNVSRLVGIGRSMDVRMPKGGAAFSVEPPKPARDWDSMDWDPEEDELFSVSGGGTTWDVYFPEDPGESCAVARMASPGNDSYEIPWCTARGKNNMFYGYAAAGMALYYVVNREEPEEKYSLGYHPGGEFAEPRDGDATVDRNNRAFDPERAFGSAWREIRRRTGEHARGRGAASRRGTVEGVAAAAQDPRLWRELVRRTSDDPWHRLMLYKPLVMPDPTAQGSEIRARMSSMHPEVAVGFLGAAASVGQGDPYFLQEVVGYVNAVFDAYGDHLPGSAAEREIEKAFEFDGDHPGGYHTVSTHLVKRMHQARREREELPAAIEALRGIGTDRKALGSWILEHAAVLPMGGTDQPEEWGRRLAEAMTDEQLAIMFWPFELVGKAVEEEFFEKRRKKTYEWGFFVWAREIRDRVMRLEGKVEPARKLRDFMRIHGKPKDSLGSYFAKLVGGQGLDPDEKARWNEILFIWKTKG